MSSNLDNARRKIRRSEQLFNELQEEVGTYWSRSPYRVTESPAPSQPQDGPDDPRVLLGVAVDEPLPSDDLALVLGDCVHNARTALDYAIYAAVAAGGREPSNQTMFPIWRRAAPPTQNQWRNEVRQCAGGAGPAVIELLGAMEPRQGGRDEPLWALHELDIIDKHRLPIVAAGAYSAVELNFGGLIPELPDAPEGLPEMWIALRPADSFPVGDGFGLFEAPRSVIEKQTPRFRFDAALAEPEPYRGRPLGEAVGGILSTAAATVEAIGSAI